MIRGFFNERGSGLRMNDPSPKSESSSVRGIGHDLPLPLVQLKPCSSCLLGDADASISMKHEELMHYKVCVDAFRQP